MKISLLIFYLFTWIAAFANGPNYYLSQPDGYFIPTKNIPENQKKQFKYSENPKNVHCIQIPGGKIGEETLLNPNIYSVREKA